MNSEYYLTKFEKAAASLDKKLVNKKGIEVETGVWLDSVVLRLQKKHWANLPFQKPQSGPAIFFSVWLNDKTLKAGKIFDNIHALRLRQLKGYSLTSREFANKFREGFKTFSNSWPNVSVNYGPLTLMEGWQKAEPEHLQNDIAALANKFLQIDFLIDDLLNANRLKKNK